MATIIVGNPSPPSTPSLSTHHGRSRSRSIVLNPNNNISLKERLKMIRSEEHIKEIHAYMTRRRLLSEQPSLSCNLVAAYSKFSNPQTLNYAVTSFRQLEKQSAIAIDDSFTLFILNSLIRGFASLGSLHTAVHLYLSIIDRGLTPDNFTFPPLFAAFSKFSSSEEVEEAGPQFHSLLIKFGLHADIFLHNSLIHFYSEVGDLDSARRVFDGMCHRNVVSWTTLIDGYANGTRPDKAVSLFFLMTQEDGIRPNSVTISCVLSACAKLQDMALAHRISAYISRSGIEFNTHLLNSLVEMYMKCGLVDKAERLLYDCIDRNVILCNTMVTNYARLGLAEEALDLFDEMLISGPKPDRVTIVGAVSASAELGELAFGRRLHGYVLRNGFDAWDAVSNAVIDMYMKCGDPNAAFGVFEMMTNRTEASWNTIIVGCARNGNLDLARRYFEIMPIRDLFSWNTMISALAKESCFEEAISLFRAMQGLGMRPDRVTMVSICSACGYLGTLDLAKWVYTYIERNKITCNIKLGTALVDMFAKCGDPDTAMKIFKGMPVRDVSAWTAAIGLMAIEGSGQQALELFSQMVDEGVEPDSVVFVAVLTALSHGGLVEEGRRLFQSMMEVYGFPPQIVHYGCMVDLLGRAGMLREARNFIDAMPIEPNDVVWGALLAASRIYCNLEIAEYAAKKVLSLAPERSGIHVLLSNAYASASKWEDVARVRLSLKDKGIQKIPGSSFIEVDGVIHEFTSTCESHPQMASIREMVNEMTERLSSCGYVPNLDNVLIYVDEEEKEFLLSRHSERMAVAFGLISTVPSMPIRVVKNLRICSDCHEYMKFVSTIYGREITIRDKNRFHHFQEGVCSCMDYW